MSVSSIVRSRLLNLFLKTVSHNRTISLIRSHKIGMTRLLLTNYNFTNFTSKYFCIAFLNLIYIAKAEGQDFDDKFPWHAEVLEEADELFKVGKFNDSLKALEPFKKSGNVEILWRISRALYNMSKNNGIKSSESAELIEKAYGYIQRALKLNKNHYAVHKWMAILHDAKCSLEGMKARIQGLPVFKEHLLRAVELNPKDATSIHMLGQYMYNLADMSWLQRNIAKTLFGDPPSATFQEAFHYFSKAEEVDPYFYSANLLMLGKTCLKLKRFEAARYWLKCATSYPVRTDEDENVRLEAEELLRKYPGPKSEKEQKKA